MANTTPSPNMSMPVPTVSTDPGPDWATNINSCLSVIDSHTHTSGQGVQITSDAINVNADLPMSNNNLTTAKSVRFTSQSAALAGASDIGCLYESGVDLYYNDGNGNQIRVTQSGSVAGSSGTITGLPSGTASAAYSGGTFSFLQATSTPASLSNGSVKIGREDTSGFGVTIGASGSQAADYSLTLPVALPAATYPVTMTSAGQLAASSSLTIPTMTVTTANVTTTNTDSLYVATGSRLGSSGPFMMTYQYTGTLASLATVTLTPGGTVIGAIGKSQVANGSTYIVMGTYVPDSGVTLYQAIYFYLGSSTTVVLYNKSATINTYNVTVFYT